MRHVPFTLALVALALMVPAEPAAADSASDSAALERLRSRIEGRSLIRVSGTFGTAELTGASLQADGLHFASGRLMGEGGAVPPSIPIDQISSVSARQRLTRKGMMAGMFAGALVAMVRESRRGTSTGGWFGGVEGMAAVFRIATYVGAGGAGGALIGSTVRRWEPIDEER